MQYKCLSLFIQKTGDTKLWKRRNKSFKKDQIQEDKKKSFVAKRSIEVGTHKSVRKKVVRKILGSEPGVSYVDSKLHSFDEFQLEQFFLFQKM